MKRWAILCTLMLLAGCAMDDRSRSASLHAIAAQHAEVDRLIDAGDPRTARQLLERMREGPLPRWVLQDIDFRIATVSLDAGDAKGALAAARRGLALGAGKDVFTANLEISAGRAHEALGAKEDAAQAYARALAIDEALLEEALAP